MDKGEFIAKAPVYYALGISIALVGAKGEAKTIGEIGNLLSTIRHYFEKEPLVDKAIELLHNSQAIEIIPDDFGPTLYKASATLDTWLAEDAPEQFPLFRKYHDSGNKSWLRSAIGEVNRQYNELHVTPDDFGDDAIEIQWEPIPLNRADKQLQATTKAVDTAIKAIEADNGYAVTVPGEREYVLSSLKNISAALKEKSQIYWIEIKTFALDPLAKVIKRFGPAAVGVAAFSARKAIIDWLKTNFSKALDWF